MIKKIFQAFIIPFALSFIAIAFYLAFEQTTLTWVIEKMLIILTLVAHVVGFNLFFISIKENLSFIESLQKAKTGFFPFWISVLKNLLFLPRIIILWIIFSAISFFYFNIISEFDINLSFFALLSFIYLHLFLFSFLSIYWCYIIEEKKVEEVKSASKGKRLIYGLLRVLGFCLVLPLLVIMFNFLFRNYDPHFDDSYFILEGKEIIEEGNLYYFINSDEHKEICYEAVGVDVERTALFSENNFSSFYEYIESFPEEAEESMNKNKNIYDCFKRMAEHTHYTSPLKQMIIDSSEYTERQSYFLTETSKIGRGAYFLIVYYHFHGEEEKALDLAMYAIKTMKMLAENPNDSLFFGLSIGWSDSLTSIIKDMDFDPALSKKYIDKLEKYEIEERVIDNYFRFLYTNNHRAIEQIEEHEDFISYNLLRRPSFAFKSNRTKRELVEFLEGQLLYFQNSELKESEELVDEFEKNILNTRKEDRILLNVLFKSNSVGRIFNYFNSVNFRYARNSRFLAMNYLRNRLIRTAFAARAYREKEGKLPESLDQLVPEHLSHVPEDIFHKGEEMSYNPEKEIIYSVRMYEVEEKDEHFYSIEI